MKATLWKELHLFTDYVKCTKFFFTYFIAPQKKKIILQEK